ncbi:TPA: molybdopterin guanine dinucleotide-containing S/N-oxide reductase [Mannheimia haemolytica]|uniref:Molybdopterin guanine dinucleotide-containing S/N-oxide reductase n=1 Tax=Mannheimia haemolytica TaxID=75985 RepID=A0A547EDT0_MANHA|nr:molybdopterin guanine dinucleotide-containing S/N-oxide reductase [Mannheimia haemolytica]AWW71273.1 molybdopterin guanine dinucleotide-containing S/N-oxide reductase [Pasteurellaceae bacterium 12565]AGI32407.1 molybdopterin guanine dinucleotide-containing S/N-oxide reductase [Mannheimia haemolytica USDA-ARS-USMARC-183]AGI35318.1 molybdopterin guanine dinucleotide-containing S/N-oxide reductase [Mannheimia haemolytica USDA-ARS-USMARC-185]AGK02473.1 biotin sulfoxide reductase BisC [Mannheimia
MNTALEKGKFVFLDKPKNTITTAAHWGALNVTVENGKVVKSEGSLAKNHQNELQDVVADQLYSPVRVKYPMVRKGYLEGNKDTTLRGRDKWVRISWDKAFELVSGEIQRVREQYGSESIFGGSYGWYSSGSLHASRTLLQRYLNVTGGFTNTKGDYSTGAVQVIMPYVLGNIEVYAQQTSWHTIVESTELLVIWSSNPLNTLRIAWTSAEPEGIDYLAKLKASGKRIICIDPVKSETCQFLEAEWLPINTGTDVALILGIAHTLITENKHDHDFLTKYTVGFEQFADYVLGKADNLPKTAEWASQICDIPEEVIKTLANDFVTHRTMLMSGWGLQRLQHGEQSHWALVTLAAMLGQIGLPGGGFGLNYRYSTNGLNVNSGVRLGAINAGKPNPDMPFFPVSRIADALLKPNQPYDYNGQTLHYPNIKLVYWAGGNPFAHHPDTNYLVKAWQQPETMIVNECYWTPTARMADIVLPATTSYERNDLTVAGDYVAKHIIPMKQVVEPQFEAKNDYDIFAELAKRAGKEQAFTEGKSEMEWLKEFYQVAFEAGEKANTPLLDFEAFWAENKVLSFEAEHQNNTFVRYQDYRTDPIKHKLATPSGKIEIFSETIAKMNYEDCKGHPTWFEHHEYSGKTNEAEPLALVTPHIKYRLHSQLAYSSLRQYYEVNGREPMLIHTKDAADRGITSGDIVRIFNKRGQVLAGAVVTDGIIQGTVALYEGGWYDPQDLGKTDTPLCKNGNPNVLTRNEGSSKLGQGNAPNTTTVQVEKYVGDAPEVTVFKAPFFSE